MGVDFCCAQLEEQKEPGEKGLDPKLLQVNLTGFMERQAGPFCSELWKHLLSAQESPVGVPQEFIDMKKDDLKKKKEEADKVQEELKRRRKDLEEQAARGKESDQPRRGGNARSRSSSPRRSTATYHDPAFDRRNKDRRQR